MNWHAMTRFYHLLIALTACCGSLQAQPTAVNAPAQPCTIPAGDNTLLFPAGDSAFTPFFEKMDRLVFAG